MSKRILFLVNGCGLGNSTRTHAIIQHLKSKYKIDVFVNGNSLKYFRQVSEIDNIFQGTSLQYKLKDGKIKFFSTVTNNLQAVYKDRNQIKKILESSHYQLIVSDSNYSTLFLKNKPKMISINSADAVIKQALKVKKKSYWPQFFIELCDYIYNLFVPDLVISPFFEDYKNKGKIYHIPLIVRKEFQTSSVNCHPRHSDGLDLHSSSKNQPAESKDVKVGKVGKLQKKVPTKNPKRHLVLIMTSGASNMNRNIKIEHIEDSYDLSILGKEIKASGRVKREAKTFNTRSLMEKSSILVLNGGLSSISEALSMQKPMVIIPIDGHIEQKINALWVENNNMGVISSWDNLSKSIAHIQSNYRHFKSHLIEYNYLNGAQKAANLIIKEVENDTLCR